MSDHDEKEETCFKVLKAAGAHINDKDIAGQTPLHMAASKGNNPILKEILKTRKAQIEVSLIDLLFAKLSFELTYYKILK